MKHDRGDAAELSRVRVPAVIGEGDLFAPTHQVPVRATTRTVKGPAPETEFQKKHATLMAMEERESTKAMMAWVRESLKSLYVVRLALRIDAFITSDDADRLLRENPLYAELAAEKGKQQWRGQIFRVGFIDTGKSVPSLRKGQKASKITAWRAIV